ncbi:D-alanine--D-alanine ligase family protein [Clostridium thermosuccinogenes]|uniref:D-alanine--D-alanine ligase family protein n=1 Tax=Clostridium thermosuccinogenes TaxID=84032 RepID=UPI000CCC78BE|nr:ATP-grasp domain-containing protein [Pseudoclostridium thermosuccinogenes]PNT91085.1 D-alanine--D-alanine ligase [Pseudoclostridium thermosuccinogenes]
MENLDNDDVPKYTAGITYNLKKGVKSDAEDEEAEYDNIETVNAIKNALEQMNCRVELFEANTDIFEKLKRTKVDILFNIAEGTKGRGREAQVPAIANIFGIPFTGSDETTLCISLDKALTKRILSTYKIRTPKYQVIEEESARLDSRLKYPLIVKPNAEGSSKGIWDFAVAEDSQELKKLISRNLNLYKQPIMVEEYIKGREFTVAVAGNKNEATVFSPMEIHYKDTGQKFNIYSYNVKKDYQKYIQYSCPADISKEIEDRMKSTALKIYNALQCRDFARIDFRLSEEEDIYFIEINPLPGLAPGYSDYPMITEFCGLSYNDTIKMILNSALKRYSMKPII